MNNKTLKALLVVSTTIACLTGTAQAATSADITLSGSVAQDCSVSLSANDYTVDIAGGETDAIVATVTEKCNDADGFVISFSSLNSGFLQNGDNDDEKKSYTISYGSGISSQSLSADRSTSYSTFTASNNVNLRMNLPEHTVGVLAAGTWSDTITISIAAVQ